MKKLLALLPLVLLILGCTSVSTITKKSELKINSKLTETVFLDPAPPERRTIFLQTRNNSDSDNFSVTDAVRYRLENNGFRIVDDPERATYWLQANVRYAGPPEGSEFQDVLDDYKGAFEGAATGIAISDITGGEGSDNVKAAFVGALLGYALDAAVDDDYYAVITDIQIAQKVKQGEVFSEQKHRLRQGESGSQVQQMNSSSDRLKFQTRALITANQANMDVEQAKLAMRDKLVKILSGLF